MRVFHRVFPLFNSSGVCSRAGCDDLIWAYSWIVMKQMMAYAGPFEFAAALFRRRAGAFVVLAAMRQSLSAPPFG